MDAATFFREFTLRISSSLEISDALASVAAFVRDVIPMDFLGLYYVHEGADSGKAFAYAVAEAGTQAGIVSPLNDPLAPIAELDAAELAELKRLRDEQSVGHVKVQNEGRPHPLLLRSVPRLDGYSGIELSLNMAGDELGVLVLMRRGRDIYDASHARLLRTVREPVRIAMSNARRYLELLVLKERLAEDNRAMHRDLERLSGTDVVGADFGLRGVMEMVRRVAPMDSPVLLLGETGTGKEVVANAVHLASPRRDGPLIRVQCGAVPDTLLDSELFGHERGAFTGALALKRGRFERAEGGTIFLDEIGELTSEAQVKLLRVLQEKEFERLGGTQTLNADVRVIAATHRDLGGMVRRGEFREDLWFRLNVFPIHLPPLRQRREDIPSLVQFFIERKTRELSLPPAPAVDAGAMDMLTAYDWPGNVRELQNVVERALIISHGGPLRFTGLTQKGEDPSEAMPVSDADFPTLDRAIEAHIREALTHSLGRVEGADGAAELLDVNPSTLRGRMRKLGIPFGRKAVRWVGE